MKRMALILLLSSLALAQRQPVGQTIDISGVKPETSKTTVQNARLEPNKLQLETGAGTITVSGYPTWLEAQQFVGSSLSTNARMLPDGIETRLELAQNNRPFLVLGSRTSPNSILIGNWRFGFKITEKTAYINLEPRTVALPLGRSVVVRQGLIIWCVRLAALHLPAPSKPNVSNEAENPRFDWAALRVMTTGQCQN